MSGYKEYKKIHFIGIGGIGVSALARYYLAKGFFVSGSDLVESEITKTLGKQGAKIIIGPHKTNNVPPDADLIVYSAAVEDKNLELAEAKRRKIKYQTYAEALGELTKKYFTIAVSGTHGKSTTSSMLALIMIKVGLDPTVIVGTKLRELGNSNFRAGKSKYLVIEADEYASSFLNYWPRIIVMTNIEEDHLDYYKDLKHIISAFKKYIGHLDKNGILIANADDKNIIKISQNSKAKSQKFSSKLKINGLNLKIPGRHNFLNAVAAITAARALKISDKFSVKALNDFNGTWRRFEYKGKLKGAKIFDDYGHHPTEIRATLKGAREYLGSLSVCRFNRKTGKVLCPKIGKIWCVFQPHQYHRTYKLFGQFAGAFDDADNVILLPIFSVAGREREYIKKKVNSKKVAFEIQKRNKKLNYKEKKAIYLESFKKCAKYLKKNLRRGDMAVLMGAGDIYKLTRYLVS